MKKSKRLEKILTKISPIKVFHDEKGNYLHYCSFGHHYGVIGELKARDCLEKECWHYRKYREEENGFR